MLKKMASIVAVLLFGALSVVSGQDTTAKVIQVVNIGTLRVEYQGLEDTIRLIGIEVPGDEENDNAVDSAVDDDEAAVMSGDQEATEFAQRLVHPGDTVTLEFDIEPRDRENHLLAYVYLTDKTMLNYEAIKKGYAIPVNMPPNTKYSGVFTLAYNQAVDNCWGLWRNGAIKQTIPSSEEQEE